MLITNLGINPVSETMAKACNKYETDEGECWAERLRIGCPFSSDDFEAVSCDEIKPEHWREVLADAPNPKEKPEPRFRFGDKVTVTLCDGKKRKAFCHTVGGDGIAYFYEGSHHTLFARWEDIREGWA